MRRRGASRYRFFAGKGGVGKTSCAVAWAGAAAAGGGRVLLVSTDPAHSLGDALGRRLSARATRVPAGRGTLHAVELDADRALTRFIAARGPLLRRIVTRGTYLDERDVDRFLRLSLPGVDELMGLVELGRLARAGAYDEVVVDTAPTGHTLRLLAMPETLRRVAAVLDDMQAKHRFLAESFGGRYRPDATEALIAELGDEGEGLHRLLRDPDRAAVTWLLLPEALALAEARDGVAALEAAGIPVSEVVVNRVAAGGGCAHCRARARAQQTVVAEARVAFPGRPVRVLPELEGEPRGLAALLPLGRGLAGRVAAATRPRRERPTCAGRRAAPAGAREGGWIERLAPPGIELLVFAGKGGVGKTTCAAAAALALAEHRPDTDVLLLSTDPAHSLGDVLGLKLADTASPVPGAPPRLRAREVDAAHAWTETRDRYQAAVAEVFHALTGESRFDVAFDRTVIEDLLDLAPPGLDELFGALSVVDALETERRGRALVVVDAAPTGHALRLLQLPDAAIQWVHAVLAVLLKYRELIGLGELGATLLDVARRLKRLATLLRDPARCRVVTVTRPAALPHAETARLVRRLTALGITPGAVIVNAVTPGTCAACRRRAAAERRVLRSSEGALIVAPEAAPPPRGVEGLARWRAQWETAS